MAKIAKQAGISASTLYVYFENQEDMFRKIYIDAKNKMMNAALIGVDIDGDVEASIKCVFRNMIQFAKENHELLMFIEQSNSSPLLSATEQENINTMFSAIEAIIKKGQKESKLKKYSPETMAGFCYYGITQMYRYAIVSGMKMDDDFDESIISMCWDSIKALT